MTWFYSQQFLISINGSYVLLEHTAAGLHTMPFSLEASGSRLGSIFGEAGHPCGVNFLFGCPLTTGVGQLIAWLPHPPACPLCDQAEENIQRILISCVFARQI